MAGLQVWDEGLDEPVLKAQGSVDERPDGGAAALVGDQRHFCALPELSAVGQQKQVQRMWASPRPGGVGQVLPRVERTRGSLEGLVRVLAAGGAACLGHEGEAMLAFEGTAEAGAGLEALAAVVVVASLGALDAVAYHKGQALVEAAA